MCPEPSSYGQMLELAQCSNFLMHTHLPTNNMNLKYQKLSQNLVILGQPACTNTQNDFDINIMHLLQ